MSFRSWWERNFKTGKHKHIAEVGKKSYTDGVENGFTLYNKFLSPEEVMEIYKKQGGA